MVEEVRLIQPCIYPGWLLLVHSDDSGRGILVFWQGVYEDLFSAAITSQCALQLEHKAIEECLLTQQSSDFSVNLKTSKTYIKHVSECK